MKSNWMVQLWTIGLALVIVGCGSNKGSPAKQSVRAVESMEQARTTMANAQAEIDTVLATLAELESGKDIPGSFKTYSASVARIESTGKKARARYEDFRERRQEYIAQWEAEAAGVQNPEVREAMDARRQRVREKFQTVAEAARGVQDAYEPFLRDLKEIQRALTLDLTAGGVTALKPAMESTRAKGATLKQNLSELQARLDDLIGRMTSTTTQPATRPAG